MKRMWRHSSESKLSLYENEKGVQQLNDREKNTQWKEQMSVKMS